MKTIALFLCSLMPLAGDNPALMHPSRVELVYENGIIVRCRVDARGLPADLSVEVNGKKLTVPDGEFEGLDHPHLEKMEFYQTFNSADNAEMWVVRMPYRYEHRSWGGVAYEEVEFVFIGNSFAYRETKVPVEETKWKLFKKLPGKDPVEQGEEFRLPGISAGEAPSPPEDKATPSTNPATPKPETPAPSSATPPPPQPSPSTATPPPAPAPSSTKP